MALLKIDDFKPLGAFIENTVRPILIELRRLGIELELEEINRVVFKLGAVHVLSVIFYCIRDIVVVLTLGYITCKTYLL